MLKRLPIVNVSFSQIGIELFELQKIQALLRPTFMSSYDSKNSLGIYLGTCMLDCEVLVINKIILSTINTGSNLGVFLTMEVIGMAEFFCSTNMGLHFH